MAAASLAVLAAIGSARITGAQVTLDGSLGPAGAVPLVDGTFSIPDTVGQTVGDNLFHSFGEFSIASGETAAFTGPATIQNILSRVTGGNPSTIDGRIDATAMPDANFIFMNPAGVMFGPNAQLDVGGSFAVTTAGYIRLGNPGDPDAGRFDAQNPANDLLTVAAPTAFGFLGPAPAAITFEGSVLQVPDGKVLSVIGGEIQIVGSQLTAFSGRINLVGAGSAGEVELVADDPFSPVDTTTLAMLTPVSVLDDSRVTISGNDATAGSPGRLYIEAEDFALRNSSLLETLNWGDGDALGVDIIARNSVTVEDLSSVDAFNFGSGAGTTVAVTAPVVRFANSAGIYSDVSGDGPGGEIVVQAGSLVLENGALFSTTAGGPGQAGDIHLTATESVSLDNGAFLVAATFDGPSGNIYVTTPLLRAGNFSSISTETYGFMDGGAIYLDVGRLELAADGYLRASTFGPGTGGLIDITASEVWIDGANSFQTGLLSGAENFDEGAGGSIFLRPPDGGTLNIELLNGAEISAASLYTGSAGTIDITATDLTLRNGSAIRSSSDETGAAGSVMVHLTGSMLLESGSSLSVAAIQAAGGDVVATAGTEIRLVDSQITAQAAGDGGNVHLSAPALVYLLGSQVTAQSDSGDGGNILIDPVFVILNGSLVTANAIIGNGGNITIVTDYFLSSDSAVTASSEFGLQGNITITSPDVDLSGNLVALDTALLAAEAQLGPHCAVRLPGGVSSFIVSGRGGAPVAPDALLPALPTLSGDQQE